MKTKISTKQLVNAGFTDETEQSHVRALCEYLETSPDSLSRESHDNYGLAVYSCGSREYAIGTDEEATDAARANIKDSVWAFNASFLSGFCDLPEEVFEAMQGKCEGANDAFLSLVEKSGKFEDFADEAISADGRGHFMSSYDGNENEQGEFLIYRIN